MHLIIKIQNGLFTRNTDFKGYRQNGLSGLADGKNIINAFDFRQDLFCWNRHQLFNVFRTGAGKANKYVGKGHVNLRFFFFGRDHNGKETKK